LALPLSVFATPALAASKPASSALSKAIVFTDRDDDENENEDEADHQEGHHQIPPVIIRPHHGGDDEEDGEDEGDDEGEDDGEGGFVVPGPIDPSNPTPTSDPSVDPLTMNNPTDTTVSTANYSVSPLAGLPGQPQTRGSQPPTNSRNLNPEAAPPVQIQQVRGPQRTPADVFMESATFGLLAVGSGALALGGVAGVRAIKLRRNPKGDYFYGDN
jgi:hypothetical protein